MEMRVCCLKKLKAGICDAAASVAEVTANQPNQSRHLISLT